MQYQLIITSPSMTKLQKLRDALGEEYEMSIHTNTKEKMRRYTKKNKPWTTQEDIALIKAYRDTVLPVKKIAYNLERTTGAVTMRIKYLQENMVLKRRRPRNGKCITAKL